MEFQGRAMQSYHQCISCCTCLRLRLPRGLQTVLQRSKTWAEAGACVAHVVIRAEPLPTGVPKTRIVRSAVIARCALLHKTKDICSLPLGDHSMSASSALPASVLGGGLSFPVSCVVTAVGHCQGNDAAG